jgi:hypothetical protein
MAPEGRAKIRQMLGLEVRPTGTGSRSAPSSPIAAGSIVQAAMADLAKWHLSAAEKEALARGGVDGTLLQHGYRPSVTAPVTFDEARRVAEEAQAPGAQQILSEYLRGHDVDMLLPPYNATLLYTAARANNLPVVEFLLTQWNADPNVAESRGNTPLHVASYNGHVRVAALLLEHGADPYARNKAGESVDSVFKEPCAATPIIALVATARQQRDEFQRATASSVSKYLNSLAFRVVPEQYPRAAASFQQLASARVPHVFASFLHLRRRMLLPLTRLLLRDMWYSAIAGWFAATSWFSDVRDSRNVIDAAAERVVPRPADVEAALEALLHEPNRAQQPLPNTIGEIEEALVAVVKPLLEERFGAHLRGLRDLVNPNDLAGVEAAGTTLHEAATASALSWAAETAAALLTQAASNLVIDVSETDVHPDLPRSCLFRGLVSRTLCQLNVDGLDATQGRYHLTGTCVEVIRLTRRKHELTVPVAKLLRFVVLSTPNATGRIRRFTADFTREAAAKLVVEPGQHTPSAPETSGWDAFANGELALAALIERVAMNGFVVAPPSPALPQPKNYFSYVATLASGSKPTDPVATWQHFQLNCELISTASAEASPALLSQAMWANDLLENIATVDGASRDAFHAARAQILHNAEVPLATMADRLQLELACAITCGATYAMAPRILAALVDHAVVIVGVPYTLAQRCPHTLFGSLVETESRGRYASVITTFASQRSRRDAEATFRDLPELHRPTTILPPGPLARQPTALNGIAIADDWTALQALTCAPASATTNLLVVDDLVGEAPCVVGRGLQVLAAVTAPRCAPWDPHTSLLVSGAVNVLFFAHHTAAEELARVIRFTYPTLSCVAVN